MQKVVLAEPLTGQKQSYVPALICLAVLYFMMGLITCLNDTLVPFFKNGFRLSYAQSSLVQFYFFLTYGVMSVPAGKIVERMGYKNGMVLGFSVSAFGALLFFPASILHQYILFLAALFIIAIGIVLLQVAANPYVTILGPARTASSRLTLVQGVGSMGTTVAPLLGSYFILNRLKESHASSEAVRYPYIGIACLLILIALIVYQLKLPQIKPGAGALETIDQGKPKTVFSFRNLNFGVWAIFVYVGAEVSIGSFLTNYIADSLKIEVHRANSFVAFYWAGMLVGRILGSVVLQSVRPPLVLRTCAALSVMLITISINGSGYIAIWSMIAVGICNSIMFATIFSLSVSGLGKYTTRASGLLSTSIVGGAVISFLVGLIKDNASWSVAFLIPLLCYLYILFYAISGYKSKFSLLS
ncbi:MAG TPA: sugar MFS transporter [Puia sp.]|nr:sugar MFS transporter [Puia sp.]